MQRTVAAQSFASLVRQVGGKDAAAATIEAAIGHSISIGSLTRIENGAAEVPLLYAWAVMANKFGAIATEVDGIRFDSLKEARRWGELRLMEKAGEIRNLRRQVRVDLEGKNGPLRTRTGRPMKLTIDFAYEDRRLGWAEVFEDSKGKPTRDYEVRRAVAEAMGIEVIET